MPGKIGPVGIGNLPVKELDFSCRNMPFSARIFLKAGLGTLGDAVPGPQRHLHR